MQDLVDKLYIELINEARPTITLKNLAILIVFIMKIVERNCNAKTGFTKKILALGVLNEILEHSNLSRNEKSIIKELAPSTIDTFVNLDKNKLFINVRKRWSFSCVK